MSAFLLAQTGHSLPLPPDPVVVGSDPSAQVPVRADLGIAARHYQIQSDPGQNGHWVVSLLPEHPVQVNGQPVPHALLRDGDVITAGALHLMYRAAVAEAPVMAATMPMAMPAMPSMPPPPPPMPPPPPQEPSAPPAEMDAPRSGYRIPGAPAPGTALEENLDYLSEGARQKILRERMMKESMARTQQQFDALKVEQNFGRACLGALLVLAVGSFLYLRLDHMSIKLWLPGTALLGQFLGWIIRRTGKGQERRFGLLAGAAAMLCVSAAGLLDYRAAEAKYQAESQVAEEGEYSQETPEEREQRLAEEEEERAEEERVEALHEAAAKASEARLRRIHPELFREYDEAAAAAEAEAAEDGTMSEEGEEELTEDALSKEEPELTEEQMREAEELATQIGETVEAGLNILLFAWILFNPKALIAYFIIGGAAYRAAFRYLSSEEASRLHLGGERQQDMSGKSLKERMQMNRTC
ncbi:MAG: hypothetical protein RLZZ476_309 [Verrucomicrobiota bacterium]|jgi:hypothetical protein